MEKVLRAAALAFLWFVVALLTLWAIAALYIDFRVSALRLPIAAVCRQSESSRSCSR